MSIEDKISWSRVEKQGDRAYALDVINKYTAQGVLSDEQKNSALQILENQGPKLAVDYVADILDATQKAGT